uniref:Angiogenic factor with G patch and FHA domains 1 n=1 Tax=Cacopsylla melanoneura TaxID=428564 RepID=A0A8D8S686_9HEMI
MELGENCKKSYIGTDQSEQTGVLIAMEPNENPKEKSEISVEILAKPVEKLETGVLIAMEPDENPEIKPKKKSDIDSKRTSSSVEDDILALFENELKDYPQVFKFIQKLQEIVDRQRKLLQKYHEKFKQFNKEVKHIDVQTDPENIVKQNTSLPDDKEGIDIQSFKDEIVQAAHSAVQNTGFVYEPVSGLYYDYNTGYYYNSELGLYYDGATSTYYYYNEEQKKFEFHSQVQSQSQQQETQHKQGKQHKQQTLVKDQPVRTKPNEVNVSTDHSKFRGNVTEPFAASEDVTPMEDTDMLSDVSSNSDLCADPEPQTKQPASEVTLQSSPLIDSELSGRFARINITSVRSRALEIANAWPPCLRIIVTETSVKGVKVGTLFIVTNLGGTIGREGEHAVLIPDINISKHHAKISFTGTEDNKDDSSKGYTIVDLGSRNGTFVDTIRLSAALQESEPHLLTHGTNLRIGGTKLSVHIHQGRDTCDQCEPGVLMCAMNKPSPVKIDLTSNSAQNRQAELKRLRKKFGLDKNPATKPTGGGGAGKLNTPGYDDRAERRRKTVGSLVEGEKTQVAHMEESIPNQNKGFKMLSKMGWKSGQTLGKDEANTNALIEPIIPQQYAKNAGLGCSAPVIRPSSDSKEERKKTVWEKTQARYNVLGHEPPPTSNSPEDEH